ncbi:hypothetical protein NC653_041615 [Populus alba x Populus x berolinensis]|uniref:Uncharacterized protein n=1 Tax=Populus alba x Populus x berolinensis TaxID=444605 RepID=A0AAD6LAK3_9ROSI|nr:hypothetical protein NC653_041615 [Populus alba x Populus x berolinensis]
MHFCGEYDCPITAIESYLQNQTPQEQVARALQEAGFCLDDKDTDMHHVESFSWPSLMDFGQVWIARKNAEKGYQLGSSLNISSYAKWRKNPIFQSQQCNGMKYNKIDFKPDASLDKDLKLLCQNICLRDWTSEKPINSLLYALGSMDSRKLLETIKSHLDKTEEIGELVCYYAREGRVVKVAALLMVAWKKLLEIFERAGDGLDQFVQWRQCSEMTKEDSTEITCLLSGLVCTSNLKGTLKCDQWSCIRCSEYELDEGESPSDFIYYYSYNRVTDVGRQIAYAFKRMPSSPYGCGRRPFHTFSISRMQLCCQAILPHENPSKSILAKTGVEGVKLFILQEVGIYGTITQQGVETCLTYLDDTDKVQYFSFMCCYQ